MSIFRRVQEQFCFVSLGCMNDALWQARNGSLPIAQKKLTTVKYQHVAMSNIRVKTSWESALSIL
jgi:hypothetical protein